MDLGAVAILGARTGLARTGLGGIVKVGVSLVVDAFVAIFLNVIVALGTTLCCGNIPDNYEC